MQVASYHEGEKQRSSMFSTGGPGRLVVYEDGGIAFFWMEDGFEPDIVQYTRIDADFP